MKITEHTTLSDLSIEFLSYGLRAAVVLVGDASRFDVTLTDPNGITAAGSSYQLADAFDRAFARYRELCGGVSFQMTCRPHTIAYASGKAIPPPPEGWSEADLEAFRRQDKP